ncbi:MAG: N-acetyltransferase [Candidatus Lokiarchaeota archaeon]|nr:N-acetyltransferase [Candidatus Lokiarchaeota archaeon]
MEGPIFYRNFLNDIVDLMFSIRVKSPEIQKYRKEVTLKDGDILLFRPITPDDDQKVLELYYSLSPETIYFRFFAGRKNVPLKRVKRFTRVNFDKNFGVVVEYKGKDKEFFNKLIGIGSFIVNPLEPEKAEMSLVIMDRFQRKGIGSILINYLVHIAKERGVKTIQGIILAENYKILKTLEKLGFKYVKKLIEGELLIEGSVDEIEKSSN